MAYSDRIRESIESSLAAKQRMLEDQALQVSLNEVVKRTIDLFKEGKSLHTCGNGGSATDAMHLAAEFTGRFYKNRKALNAEFLNPNDSALTAIANDFGYDQVFARMVEAKCRKGDMLWAFSTSGNSANILRAAEKAREMGVPVIGFTGANGGALRPLCDILLAMPSDDTPRIQEMHMLAGHVICQLVEEAFL